MVAKCIRGLSRHNFGSGALRAVQGLGFGTPRQRDNLPSLVCVATDLQQKPKNKRRAWRRAVYSKSYFMSNICLARLMETVRRRW